MTAAIAPQSQSEGLGDLRHLPGQVRLHEGRLVRLAAIDGDYAVVKTALGYFLRVNLRDLLEPVCG